MSCRQGRAPPMIRSAECRIARPCGPVRCCSHTKQWCSPSGHSRWCRNKNSWVSEGLSGISSSVWGETIFVLPFSPESQCTMPRSGPQWCLLIGWDSRQTVVGPLCRAMRSRCSPWPAAQSTSSPQRWVQPDLVLVWFLWLGFLGTGMMVDFLKHMGMTDWARDRLNIIVDTGSCS